MSLNKKEIEKKVKKLSKQLNIDSHTIETYLEAFDYNEELVIEELYKLNIPLEINTNKKRKRKNNDYEGYRNKKRMNCDTCIFLLIKFI